ncbi:hypothetical protein FKM82_025277 [Ascaphus truei]
MAQSRVHCGRGFIILFCFVITKDKLNPPPPSPKKIHFKRRSHKSHFWHSSEEICRDLLLMQNTAGTPATCLIFKTYSANRASESYETLCLAWNTLHSPIHVCESSLSYSVHSFNLLRTDPWQIERLFLIRN